MKHEIEKFLDALETIITEVDLELYQWQADIDMLVFAGQSVPLVLYKEGDRIGEGWARLHHDDSALTMVADGIQPAGELFRRLEEGKSSYFDEPRDPLPLVQYKNGKREEIGFKREAAQIDTQAKIQQAQIGAQSAQQQADIKTQQAEQQMEHGQQAFEQKSALTEQQAQAKAMPGAV